MVEVLQSCLYQYFVVDVVHNRRISNSSLEPAALVTKKKMLREHPGQASRQLSSSDNSTCSPYQVLELQKVTLHYGIHARLLTDSRDDAKPCACVATATRPRVCRHYRAMKPTFQVLNHEPPLCAYIHMCIPFSTWAKPLQLQLERSVDGQDLRRRKAVPDISSQVLVYA